MFKDQPGIIPSLDVDLSDAIKIARDIKDLKQEVSGLKIGSILAWKYGLKKVVEELNEISDFPIIFDAQKACTDIPDIVKEQVKVVADADIDAFIASPHGAGSETLKAFIKACFDYNVVPIVVLEMTHPDSNAFLSKDAFEKILNLSLDMGVENFVAPANKPERLKVYKDISGRLNREINILSPGVGPQGGGPDSAVESGTDFVIVGRSIYHARDPRIETIKIYKLIKEAYATRKSLK